MRLVFFEFGPGNGMMATEVADCEGMTEEQLGVLAWEMAIDQANSYGPVYIDMADIPEDADDEQYFTECDLEYWWEDYVPEKHDQLCAGGGSFMEEFK